MHYQLFAAIGVFLLSYIIIISEKVHRTVVALTGAMLMILLGVITQEQAIHGVDFNTLGLLIGMMVVVGITRHSGVFQCIALWAAKVGKGKPIKIFVILALITAVFSALLDNVTTVLLIVPVIFVIANNLQVSPKPFLLGTILFSNIGGAATLIGDPPNIIIGSSAKLSFNTFLIHMGPPALIILLVTLGLLYLKYRKKLKTTAKARKRVMNFNPKQAISDVKLLKKSLFVIGLVLIGFLTHSITHLEGATIALSGAALLLLLTMNDPEHHLRDVEWTTIFFFIGLFILVAGLEHTGVIGMLAEKLLDMTGGNPLGLAMSILWGSAIFSAIIDNIPFVATMVPLIHDIGAISGITLAPLWWALALGADIGGNATIVGASANIIVKGMAEREGHAFSFWEYTKAAAVLTFIGIIIASGYVWLRYF
jgi:Na+/H+ antiporter NhaD/arsenite permease-like protein